MMLYLNYIYNSSPSGFFKTWRSNNRTHQRQADLDDPSLKEKFQQLFDKTMKAGWVNFSVQNATVDWLL